MDQKNTKPGDVIIVRVGGKEYETVIDAHGVQRFRENSAVRALLNLAKAGGGLNELRGEYSEGDNGISQRDYAELNMMLGYSVSGFSELSCFQDMEIENPLWDQ